MKICILHHQTRFYGTYWRCWFFARELTNLGHSVTLMTVGQSNRWKHRWSLVDGVDLYEGATLLQNLPGKGAGPIDIYARTLKLISEKWDIVHPFEFFPNVSVPSLVARLKTRVLVSDWCDWYAYSEFGSRWGHYAWVKKTKNFLESKFRKYVDGVTVISSALEENVRSLGVPVDRIRRIPGGFPIDLCPKIGKIEARSRRDVTSDAEIILFAGSNQADIDILISAFELLAEMRPKAQLYIIGKLHQNTADLIDISPAKKMIKTTGYLPYDIYWEWMATADVLALPLRDNIGNRSRWPNKSIEYLASGRPVVACAVGEVERLFKQHSLRWLCNPDPVSMAETLDVALQSNSLQYEFGQKGRDIAESFYNWSKLAEDLSNFYEYLLSF
jgi:glycosyltransferase involved in cell wall biosynthesis